MHTSKSDPQEKNRAYLFKSFREKIEYFRSKVARRVFVLFILCALIPLGVIAYYSFSQVTGNLYAQAHRQLHQASKASGMATFERLLMLETDLNMMGTSFQKGRKGCWLIQFMDSMTG